MEYKIVNITQLRPHPLNKEIYGDGYDEELINSIDKEGILTPLRISKKNEIISGHRRHAAAIELGITEVPVVYSGQNDDLLIRKEIIESNRQRDKTNEQKAREYRVLKEIEHEILKRNQQAAGGDRKSEEYKKSVVENLPQPKAEKTNKARDKAAETIGMSGKSAETASKVVDTIDKYKEAGDDERAEELTERLNKSVNGAYKQAQQYENVEPPTKKNHKPQFNQTNENIEWAKWTWNPVTGCLHGCEYCYARDIANRFYDHGFEPHFYPERLTAPENTKVPAKEDIGWKNVFVSSMGDLFGAWVEQDWIDQVIDAVHNNPQWNFLFLTKNPARLATIAWPHNAWVGTTVDCQDRVQSAYAAFEQMHNENNKPTVSFISFEPLTERIEIDLRYFDWAIIGGQSKSSGSPGMQPLWDWVEDLHMQARKFGCKIYWKPNLQVRPKEYPDFV